MTAELSTAGEQRAFDLHQGFPDYSALDGHRRRCFRASRSRTCERPRGAVPGPAHGVTKRHELRSLQEEDLRLQQAAAFELDAAQRHHKGIVGVGFHRKQRGRPDAGMHRVGERCEIDRLCEGTIRYPVDRRRKPCTSPRTGPNSPGQDLAPTRLRASEVRRSRSHGRTARSIRSARRLRASGAG